MFNLKKIKILNANAIKFLAAALMLADHIGMLWGIIFLRALGRVSMPLFAYMLAEGCFYTRNKTKHFLSVFLLGLGCQIVYALVDTSQIYLNILLTFSISILLVYCLQNFKKNLFNEQKSILKIVLSGAIFVGSVILTYLVNEINNIGGKLFIIDYGFWGCMLPIFAELFNYKRVPTGAESAVDKSQSSAEVLSLVNLASFAVGMVLLCLSFPWRLQWCALFALIPLAMYNGQKGVLNTKYFFYIFYPSHLAILYVLYMII